MFRGQIEAAISIEVFIGYSILYFDGDVFKRFVEQVTVYSRTEIGFELKCGITLKERLVR